MSAKVYESYSDSGISWIGKIPSHWTLLRAKNLLAERQNPTDSSLPCGAISFGRVVEKDSESIPVETKRTYQEVYSGEYLINPINLNYDLKSLRTALSDINVCVSPAYIIAKANEKLLNLKYGSYLLHVFDLFQMKRLGEGVRQTIRFADIGACLLCVPPLSEQAVIASVLDHETAKIDALVEEQQCLIELLQEKRQAVISHAVMKGLDPSASMRESGVEWIGQLPDNWKTVPLKHLCSLLKDGTHLPPSRVDDGVPLLSVRNIQSGVFSKLDDDSMISDESYEELCRSFVPMPSDVLLAIVGGTIGKTAVIPDNMGRFHIQRSLAIFRTHVNLVTAAWLHLVFQSNGFQSLLWKNVGFSAQPGIYLGTLSDIRIPVPPLDVQSEIVGVIGGISFNLDQLVNESQSGVTLLGERRTALISAAVTGKIDVRNWQAKEQKQEERAAA